MPASTPLVLVADDEPSMLELVARHLKTMREPKLEVIEASDGEQAWRMAREHLPDLVVLDVMMPGMSGWEVCRKIREDVALAHTGVVMLTGIGENLNQMTSPLYGADAYIDKPFDFNELDAKVRSALSSRAAQRDSVARPRMNGVGSGAGAKSGGGGGSSSSGASGAGGGGGASGGGGGAGARGGSTARSARGSSRTTSGRSAKKSSTKTSRTASASRVSKKRAPTTSKKATKSAKPTKTAGKRAAVAKPTKQTAKRPTRVATKKTTQKSGRRKAGRS